MSISTKITSIAMPAALCAALSLTATSCADNDLLDRAVDGSRSIRFEVADAAKAQSRSGAAMMMPTVALATADGDSLYALPRVIRAIGTQGRGASRAAAVTSDNIADFGVFAAINAGQGDLVAGYMDNVEVTRDNGWAPADEYLWPADAPLHISAYSPFRAVPDSGEGIVSITADASGRVALGFVTPADVTDQPDLMWVTPVDASASPCPLTFNHALTAVRFATGSKMVPCTVDRIEIDGVLSSGTLDIESGEWSGMSHAASFAVEPALTLSATDGQQYVAADVDITDDDHTMMMLPQTLADDATLSLTVTTADGNSARYTASLAGQVWEPGTTVVYNLSASADSQSLILEILDKDGNQLTELATPYTGGNLAYTVKSVCRTSGGEDADVAWRAEFIDNAGNVIARPDWVTAFTDSGDGSADCTLTTDLPEPIFLRQSERTQHLRATADINTSSGRERYNLANATGGQSVENTANCYVINAPGRYSLPLVYGNAVKNGATNEAAYISTLSQTTAHKRSALFHFVNHLGNPITDPYIYNNTGCKAADAVLVWEDRLNIVRNIELSADGHSLNFDIPASSIRQGNALVAVRDADGNIMWSWHLWITDYKPDAEWAEISANGKTYKVSTHNIGRIFAGDVTEFAAQEVTVRFTQTDAPAGMTPLTATFKLTQAGNTVETPDFCPFYQWGRKDPIISSVNEYYNSARQEVRNTNIPTEAADNVHLNIISTGIRRPDCFFTGDDATMRSVSPFYANLWNIDNIVSNPNAVMADNVKTIYDPSPVGLKVPVGNSFKQLIEYPHTFDAAQRGVIFTLPGGGTLYIPTFGYRDNKGVDINTTGTGNNWTAVAARATTARYLNVTASADANFNTNNALYAFSIRAEQDE